VQDYGAIGGAAHARIGDANHIGNTLLQDLRRQRHVSYFGHSWISAGSAVFEDHHARLVDVELRIIDASAEILNVFENDGAAAMLHQVGRCCRGFEDCAIGAEISFQDCDAAVRFQCFPGCANDIAVVTRRFSNVLAHGLSIYSEGVAMNEIAEFTDNSRQSSRVIKVLHQVLAGRHQVYETGDIATESVPVIQCEFDSNAASKSEKMNHRVG